MAPWSKPSHLKTPLKVLSDSTFAINNARLRTPLLGVHGQRSYWGT